MTLLPSANAIDIIKHFESCRLNAYPDPVHKDGLPITIGWGHTGPSVVLGAKIDQQTADALLRLDLTYATVPLHELKLNQNQFDALCSFIFNVGATAFQKSTLRQLLVAEDYTQAAEELLKWDHGGGKVVPGLLKRRLAEHSLFLKSENEGQP